MNEVPSFRLAGFVVPQPDVRNIRMISFPCFVLPIFEADGKIWIQDGGSDGRIAEFVAFRPKFDIAVSLREFIERFGPLFGSPIFMRGVVRDGPPRMYLWSSDVFGFPADVGGENYSDYVTVGQPLRFGFVYEPWHVLYGERVLLQEKLKADSRRYEWSPFISAEVAEFLGDKKWYRDSIEAAAKVIALDDERISAKWRAFMLLQDVDGNDEKIVS